MERERGCRQGLHDQQRAPPVHEILHPFPAGERGRLDDSAGSGRHGDTSDISLTASSSVTKLSATAPSSHSCATKRFNRLGLVLSLLAWTDRYPTPLATASGGVPRGRVPTAHSRCAVRARRGGCLTGAASRGAICYRPGACCTPAQHDAQLERRSSLGDRNKESTAAVLLVPTAVQAHQQ